MRGQHKFCYAQKFCISYFTVINSEDSAFVLLEMFELFNLYGILTQIRIRYEGYLSRKRPIRGQYICFTETSRRSFLFCFLTKFIDYVC